MKNKSSAQTNPESIQFHKNKERIDPFKIQLQAPGVDIPGFGKHYPCLFPKGPMTRPQASFIRDLDVHHDPSFWNRGGGRWFHSRRRGGQVGRQRERGLPRMPFPT